MWEEVKGTEIGLKPEEAANIRTTSFPQKQ